MERRTLLAAGGVGLIAAAGAGGALLLTPGEARRQGAALKVLTPSEQVTAEAFGEALLPGAREDGVAHFIDDQLAVPPADCLLMLRYFDWPAPYLPFYRGGLAALDAYCQARFGKLFAKLDTREADGVVEAVFKGEAQPWAGPPAPLFYMAMRSDAVDVVYGTVEGFKKLGVPYMPHIEPPRRW